MSDSVTVPFECVIEGDAPSAAVWLEYPHEREPGPPRNIRRDAGGWWFIGPYRTGRPPNEGLLVFPGAEPIPVTLSVTPSGVVTCGEAPLRVRPPTRTLAGAVHDPEGRSGPFEVMGCGGFAVTDPQGGFVLAAALEASGARHCWLYARAPDGEWGGPVFQEIPEAAQVVRDVYATTAPAGVVKLLGVDVRVTPPGLEVVRPLAPPWFGRGPIRVGDVVTALDGHSLAGGLRAPWWRLAALGGHHVVDAVRSDGSPFFVGFGPQGVVPLDHTDPWAER